MRVRRWPNDLKLPSQGKIEEQLWINLNRRTSSLGYALHGKNAKLGVFLAYVVL